MNGRCGEPGAAKDDAVAMSGQNGRQTKLY